MNKDKNMVDPSSESCSVLMITENFPTARKNILQHIRQKNGFVIYFSLNKPCFKVREMLRENGISDSQSFIISNVRAPSQEKTENCRLIDASDLTNIAIMIAEIYSAVDMKKIFVLDSLDGLFIYEEPNLILSFLHDLLEKNVMCNGEIYILTAPLEHKEFKQIFSMTDKVIRGVDII